MSQLDTGLGAITIERLAPHEYEASMDVDGHRLVVCRADPYDAQQALVDFLADETLGREEARWRRGARHSGLLTNTQWDDIIMTRREQRERAE